MLDRVRRWAPTSFPMPSAADLRAGLVHGLVSVPDGLATGLLAGLNPIAGLYGYLFGTLAGALTTSSALMSVQATGATLGAFGLGMLVAVGALALLGRIRP